MPAEIRYLRREQIDTGKWDETVIKNDNGLIYAQSVFLDIMAENWNAIVVNDYAAILPLPTRRKWGIPYYFHPAFVQQLGLIGYIDNSLYPKIIDLVFRTVHYGDLLFNYDNGHAAAILPSKKRTNFVIDLSSSYQSIAAGFHPNVRRTLVTASETGLQYQQLEDVGEVIDFYKEQVGSRSRTPSLSDYANFKDLCSYYQKKGGVFNRKVVNSKGELLSAALFLIDNKRVYNVMSAVTPVGRTVEALRFLLNEVFLEFAGRPLLFDFEGSDLPGVRAFYSKFGAVEQPYFSVHYNQLNFLAKLFKK